MGNLSILAFQHKSIQLYRNFKIFLTLRKPIFMAGLQVLISKRYLHFEKNSGRLRR